MSLFAYGSMTEGMVHYQKIAEFVRGTQEAAIMGTAYRLSVGFPVVLKEGSDLIPGQLLRIEAGPFFWELLDRFHGVHPQDPAKSLYVREEVRAYVDDRPVPAWAYFLNPDKLPSPSRRIEGGDWMSQLRREPALTERLTERQKRYILRLGASTGREIIPIDLALYRELMNLEIIVDKGRRLALTKLGHEVYRYLR